jgi:DNA-binding transcriptional MerR regulator
MPPSSAPPIRQRPTRDNTSEAEMTVEDLSSKTGVSVRNIRAYQTAGLVPPPRLQGRLGLYSAEHQGKLELVRDLRQQGFRLDAIKEMLKKTPQGAWSEYSLISDLFSTTFFTVESPQRKALAEMAEHWQAPATPEQKNRLSKNGLYRAIQESDEVEILSPALERIGIQLAELDVPLDTVLDLQDELIRHTRAIAKAYVEQVFLTIVKRLAPTSKDSQTKSLAQELAALEQIQSLFERLRPLAIGSISAAFPVVLQQEFDKSVSKQLKRKA